MDQTVKRIITIGLLVSIQVSLFVFAQTDSLRLESLLERSTHFINVSPQPDSALSYLQQMEKLSQQLAHHPYYVLSLLAQFRVHSELKAVEEAEVFAFAALAAADSLLPPEDPQIGTACSNMGVHFSVKGNYPLAIQYYRKALAYFDPESVDLNTLAGYLTTNLNIGANARGWGDYYLALRHYERALDIATAHLGENPYFVGRSLHTQFEIGQVYFLLEEYPEAIQRLESTLAQIQEYGRQNQIIHLRTLHRLGDAYQKQGDLDKALATMEAAQTVQAAYQERSKRFFEAEMAPHILGKIYTDLQQYERAEQYFHQSNQLLSQQPMVGQRHPLMGSQLVGLGEHYQARGMEAAALRTFQQAIIHYCYTFDDSVSLTNPQPTDIAISPPKLMQALRQKGEILHAKGKTDSTFLLASLDTYDLLLSLIDRDRQSHQAEGSKLFLLREAVPAYEGAIGLAAELFQETGDSFYAEYAFQLAEKSKAILLFDAIKNSAARYQAGVPEDLLNQEQSLQADISYYQKQLHEEMRRASPSDSLLRLYRRELFSFNESLQALTHELEKSYPQYYQLKYSHSRLSVQAIQRNLQQTGEQLLEYFMGEENIFVFLLDQEQLQIHSVPRSAEFDQQLTLVLASLHSNGSPDKAQFISTSHSLYQQLLAPLLKESTPNLLIIPAGKLGYLPFEVLLTKPVPSETSYSQLPYLLQHYAIHYAYSAQLLYQDPTLNRKKEPNQKWLGYAPIYPGTETLPYNQAEVSRIATLLDGETKLGPEATVRNFLDQASQYSFLHLSMHGYPNNENPMYAYLSFSQDSFSSDSSRLYAYQIFDLPLHTEMVVLSACKTGYGPLAQGEGILSLSRAFRYAGCPSIVTSLWNADGRASQAILHSYYSYLQAHKNKAEALRLAKLDFLQSATPNRQNPRFWAHFVIVGDQSPLKSQLPFWAYIVGGSILLILLGLFLPHLTNIRHPGQKN